MPSPSRVLVLGAATPAGRAFIAEHLAAGATVFAVDRDAAPLADLADDCQEHLADLVPLTARAEDPDEAARLAALLVAAYGAVHQAVSAGPPLPPEAAAALAPALAPGVRLTQLLAK